MRSRAAVLVCSLALSGAFAQEQPPTFEGGVNLVLVPVVVRDRQGKAVAGIAQNDFRVFDNGKPQSVTYFAVETAAGPRASAPAAPPAKTGGPPPAAAQRPLRFVAYLFDDVHLNTEDLARVRDEVDRQLATLEPTARAAIFTTSGRATLEFTADRDLLHQALLKLQPNPLTRLPVRQCPDVNYYMGYTIVSQGGDVGKGDNVEALQAAARETMICDRLMPYEWELAIRLSQGAARRAVAAGNRETKAAYMALKQLVRRMAAVPGQRTIVLLSPGFLTVEGAEADFNDAVDLANRLKVTINALDARGLYAPGVADAAGREYDEFTRRVKEQLDSQAATIESQVLAQVADGTGGVLVERTNDLGGGLKRVAGRPEYLYVLGFGPRDLKADGSFHKLKVRLAGGEKLSVQARLGYYASKWLADPAETARRELQEAVFSPEDLKDPAVEVHTEFYKSDAAKARLTVLARLDVDHLRLVKTGGRNANDLTIVSCLFDRNGNFVAGKQQAVKLRLKDATVAARRDEGLTVKTSFEVAPGVYAVRTVLRDARGDLMSAGTSVVEIP